MERIRKSDSEITTILSAFRRSRKNQRQFCKEQGISYWTFRNWLHRGKKPLAKIQPPLPVISFSPQNDAVGERYEIRFADMTTLRIPTTVPVNQIIAALRGTQ